MLADMTPTATPAAPKTAAPTKSVVAKPTIAPDPVGTSPTPPNPGGTLPIATDPIAAPPASDRPTAQPAAPSSGSTSTPPSDRPSTQPVGTPVTVSPLSTDDPMAFFPTTTPTNGLTPPPPTTIDFGSLPTPTGYYSDTSVPPTQSANPTAAIPDSTPSAQTSTNGTVNLTPTTPSSALTNYTITPGELADRVGLAKQRIADWNSIEQPAYEQTINTIAQNRAGAGQLGSGMLRGAYRDAATDYNTRRLAAESGFLSDALQGSIDDAYKNVGIAQQQQQFQQDQSNTAFNQNVTLQQLQDSEQGQQWTQLMQAVGFNAQQIQQAFENAYNVQKLSDDETGQAFNQAMQQFLVGQSGSPEDFYKYLAGLYALPQTGT